MASVKHFEVEVKVVVVDRAGRRTTVDEHTERCDTMRVAKKVFDGAIDGLIGASSKA